VWIRDGGIRSKGGFESGGCLTAGKGGMGRTRSEIFTASLELLEGKCTKIDIFQIVNY
jgi:hypothetical protein